MTTWQMYRRYMMVGFAALPLGLFLGTGYLHNPTATPTTTATELPCRFKCGEIHFKCASDSCAACVQWCIDNFKGVNK